MKTALSVSNCYLPEKAPLYRHGSILKCQEYWSSWYLDSLEAFPKERSCWIFPDSKWNFPCCCPHNHCSNSETINCFVQNYCCYFYTLSIWIQEKILLLKKSCRCEDHSSFRISQWCKCNTPGCSLVSA